MIVFRVLVALAGAALVAATLRSAIRTFVVPRSINDRLTYFVFNSVLKLFTLRMRWATTYEDRDRVLAMFAPLGLLGLPLVWVALVLLGYTAIFWGLELPALEKAFRDSGSSLLTLGFESVNDFPA